jgi:hypothetical protein
VIVMLNRRGTTSIRAAVVVLATLFAGVVLTGASRGSESKGRHYFKDSCKSCHTKGAKGGEITPMTKTQAQWRTYFQKARHSDGTEPLDKVMAADKLLDVQAFLVNHAADSPQPETCGK